MTLYTITDWAGLIPIFVAVSFGIMGLAQLIRRKSLIKVDIDILILGVYYVVVASLYVVFEMIPINFRPILINGFMETSYPSSTTLLVLGVMPTLAEQINRRCKNGTIKLLFYVFTSAFSVWMVISRLISGVHWFTDILGSVIISVGLFYMYKGVILIAVKKV
jgi:undecaprenyl-diphosphatase